MKRVTVSVPLLLVAVIGAFGQGTAAVMAAAPALEIRKVCPSLRYVGRKANFEITVTNRGDAAAYNVVVNDPIPAGLDFVSVDARGKREGNNLVWRLSTLEPGASAVLTASFMCNRIGKFRNNATVSYCAEDESGCELEVKGIPAILLECVDDPDPIEINGSVTYTITVTNQGSAVGTGIMIACTLPPEQQYTTSQGPTTAQTVGQNVTFAPLATLAPKARAVYKVTVKGIGVGDVRFKVELNSDQINRPVNETESTHIYE